jgi:hypothetical protein
MINDKYTGFVGGEWVTLSTESWADAERVIRERYQDELTVAGSIVVIRAVYRMDITPNYWLIVSNRTVEA